MLIALQKWLNISVQTLFTFGKLFKMPNTKHDRDLVSSKQEYEPQKIADKFDIPVSKVREIMLQVGKDGKPCRSRKVIYKAIREMQNVEQ